MNDDLETLLARLKPCGVRPELRSQMLTAAASRLHEESVARRFRYVVMTVAASIFLGIGLNFWVCENADRRLTQWFGPPPASKQAMAVACMVEEVTDAETAQWVFQQLTSHRAVNDSRTDYVAYCETLKRLIAELQSDARGDWDATPQKGLFMDRNHSGRAGGDPFGCQRRVDPVERCTA